MPVSFHENSLSTSLLGSSAESSNKYSIASIPETNGYKHAELDCGKNTDFDVAVQFEKFSQ